MEDKQNNPNKFSPCAMCHTGHDYNPELCDGICEFVDIVHERDVLREVNRRAKDDLIKILNYLSM